MDGVATGEAPQWNVAKQMQPVQPARFIVAFVVHYWKMFCLFSCLFLLLFLWSVTLFQMNVYQGNEVKCLFSHYLYQFSKKNTDHFQVSGALSGHAQMVADGLLCFYSYMLSMDNIRSESSIKFIKLCDDKYHDLNVSCTKEVIFYVRLNAAHCVSVIHGEHVQVVDS